MRTQGVFRAAVLTASLITASGGHAAEGLQASPTEVWPVLQARLNMVLARPSAGRVAAVQQGALLGDVYLDRHGRNPEARWRGGFRATSGLLLGGIGLSTAGAGRDWSASLLSLHQAAAEPERDVWPYVGFGYSGLAPRWGWGFSADLGIALRQGAVAAELGRAIFGLKGWEGTLRRLDAMPMLQLGVHYRF